MTMTQNGSEAAAHDKLCEVSIRMKELSDKSILILIFLSVGFAAWRLLEATPVPSPRALALVDLCSLPSDPRVVPLKEIRWNNLTWYAILH